MKYSAIYIPAALLLFLSACSSKEEKKEDDNEVVNPKVKIETVGEREVDQMATYTATVEPNLINNISAQMSNRIREIYVDEGMRVAKGQKLVLLDDVNTTSYQIQVDNARANLNNVKVNYDRALQLYQIGGGTKQQVDQMENQLINARNALAAAERTLKNAAENTVLVSPINGVVTARNYDPGDMTGALPILTIGQMQPVKVVFNVSETELSKIHKGMPAVVTFDTYEDQKFNGTVTLISPTVDNAAKTFGVEVTLPNSDGKVLPGMFGRVSMNLGKATHVVVPDLAVVKQPGSGNQYVYIYENGKVKYVQVELGQRIGDSYEILSGVPDGSKVVISGQSKLSNGVAVDVIK